MGGGLVAGRISDPSFRSRQGRLLFSYSPFWVFSSGVLINLPACFLTFQSTRTRTEDVMVRTPNMLMLLEQRASLILATSPGVSSRPTPLIVMRAIPILAAIARPWGSFATTSWSLDICRRRLGVWLR